MPNTQYGSALFSGECPKCKSQVKPADSLSVNEFMRDAINEIKNTAAAVCKKCGTVRVRFIKFLLILLLPIILSLSCGGELVEGILIGAGSGKALTEAQELAQEKKTALIAEILALREKLAQSTDPIEVAALQDKLDSAEQKQRYAELTDTIAIQVKAGLERDWGEKPAQGEQGASNLTYLLGAAATIAASYAGKKTLDDKRKAESIARIKISAKPPEERKIYEAAGPTA